MQLSVAGVGLSYDGVTVLSDVSFTLGAGEKALVLGPSGSGKSSLLNIICGLQGADTGEVRLGDQNMDARREPLGSDSLRRWHMGIVFQTLRLVSALTVRGNLLLAQRLQKGSTDPAMVDTALEQLGIAGKAHSKPHQLSQGEAQRAAIARALVVSPSILIADEPTSALDHANTEIVAKLLIEAADSAGASLLIATHDDRLSPHFERRIELSEGRVKG